MQHEDDLQPGEKDLVLSRVRKSGTRTQGTAIPERIHTKVLDWQEQFLLCSSPG